MLSSLGIGQWLNFLDVKLNLSSLHRRLRCSSLTLHLHSYLFSSCEHLQKLCHQQLHVIGIGATFSSIRPMTKAKMHNDFGDRKTRAGIVSYHKYQSFLMNHSALLKMPSTKFRSERCQDSDACSFSCNLL